jgi:FkbM family methyltransferase
MLAGERRHRVADAQSARPARIDMMKIDVEGAEAHVLAGIPNLLFE